MRGEDRRSSFPGCPRAETPPHAWGRPYHSGDIYRLVRNTPTCVGKTSRAFTFSPVSQKHPHMRGEDRANLTERAATLETPPHAWGRQRPQSLLELFLRNTPTCVGKTAASMLMVSTPRKHPHMRGEDEPPCPLALRRRETPPHAWGRLLRGRLAEVGGGNTPTCVGKTMAELP